jgi:hypothetical protein
VSGTNGQYKRSKPQRKSATVRRVTVSEDAKKKYEDLVRARDEREQVYGRHLGDEWKTKR